MVELGYNYRLTDIGAALGSSQLARLDRFLERRRALAARYLERLAGHPYLDLPVVEAGAEPAWHFCFARLRLERLSVDRGGVFRALRAENIGVNVHYIPVHQHPFYRERYPGPQLPGRRGRLRATADAAAPCRHDRRGRGRRRRRARQGSRRVRALGGIGTSPGDLNLRCNIDHGRSLKPEQWSSQQMAGRHFGAYLRVLRR